MSGYYFAFLADDRGEPTDIDVGGGGTETAAARVAVRMSNMYQRHVAVVQKDRVTGKQKVLQVVKWMGHAQPLPEPVPEPPAPSMFDRQYLTANTARKAGRFIVKWIQQGYTVTIFPKSPGVVELMASKKRENNG